MTTPDDHWNKNPEWTNEDVDLWREHMEEYFDLWWQAPELECGHGRLSTNLEGANKDLVKRCVAGHVLIMPALYGRAKVIDENTPLAPLSFDP